MRGLWVVRSVVFSAFVSVTAFAQSEVSIKIDETKLTVQRLACETFGSDFILTAADQDRHLKIALRNYLSVKKNAKTSKLSFAVTDPTVGAVVITELKDTRNQFHISKAANPASQCTVEVTTADPKATVALTCTKLTYHLNDKETRIPLDEQSANSLENVSGVIQCDVQSKTY